MAQRININNLFNQAKMFSGKQIQEFEFFYDEQQKCYWFGEKKRREK